MFLINTMRISKESKKSGCYLIREVSARKENEKKSFSISATNQISPNYTSFEAKSRR